MQVNLYGSENIELFFFRWLLFPQLDSYCEFTSRSSAVFPALLACDDSKISDRALHARTYGLPSGKRRAVEAMGFCASNNILKNTVATASYAVFLAAKRRLCKRRRSVWSTRCVCRGKECRDVVQSDGRSILQPLFLYVRSIVQFHVTDYASPRPPPRKDHVRETSEPTIKADREKRI